MSDADEGGASSEAVHTETPELPEEVFFQVKDLEPGQKEVSLDVSQMTSEDLERVCAGLQGPDCTVEVLRLTGSRLSERFCSALKANPSSLRELHLMEVLLSEPFLLNLLCDALESPHCRITTLRLVDCSLSRISCVRLNEAMKRNPSHLEELDLSQNPLKDSGVEVLCDGLRKESCRVQRLNLTSCYLTGDSCRHLNRVLMSTSGRLQELNLSHNPLEDVGMEHLSAGLRSSECKLRVLRLSQCKVTDRGGAFLIRALERRTVRLEKLDLLGNDFSSQGWMMLEQFLIHSGIGANLRFFQVKDLEPGQKEVSLDVSLMTSQDLERVCAGLEGPDCTVEVLRLTGSWLSERLCSALKANPSSLRELHLTAVRLSEPFLLNLLCDALESPHCRITTLRLVDCSLSRISCVRLNEAMKRNPSHLEELDLSQNPLKDSGVEVLCDGLTEESCRVQRLNLTSCYLTGDSCRHLNRVLMSTSGRLQELNLSHNPLEDVGMEHLSAGLRSSECKLRVLRLSQCKVTDRGGAVLIRALKRRTVRLEKLDLLENHFSSKGRMMLEQFQIHSGLGANFRFFQVKDLEPGQKEVSLDVSLMTSQDLERVCAGLEGPDCTVEVLRLTGSWLSERLCSALKANPSSLRELHLTEVLLSEPFVLNLLCDALESPHCRITTLRLVDCSLSRISCVRLNEAMKRNPSHLEELDLSQNPLKDSGVEVLCDGLTEESCRVQRLNLTSCYLTGDSCRHLNRVLMSTSGRLQELNLSHNPLEDVGMEHLSAGLRSSECKLRVLRLSQCKVTDRGGAFLIGALERRTVRLEKLDLLGNDFSVQGRMMLEQFQIHSGLGANLRFFQVKDLEPGQKEVSLDVSQMTSEDLERVCAGLEGPDCTVEVLRLTGSRLSERLCSALKANPSSLRELHLTAVRLSDHLVLNRLCDALESPHCRITTLRLVDCSLSRISCVRLNEAMKRNPSHLEELDLSQNPLKDSGVEVLCDGLRKESCRVQRLNLTSCYLTGDSCRHLNRVLMSTSGRLQELNLSHNPLEDFGMKHLSAGLSSSECKLRVLRLSQCKVTDRGGAVLIRALERRTVRLEKLELLENHFSIQGRMMLEQFQIQSGIGVHFRFFQVKDLEPGQKEVSLDVSQMTSEDLERVCAGLEGPDCTVEVLRLTGSRLSERFCSALKANPSSLRELHLMEVRLSDHLLLNLLCDALESPHCRITTLRLVDCSLSRISCVRLNEAMKRNPSHLEELDLSQNPLKDSGVEVLCDGLTEESCRVQRLNLTSCYLTGDSCRHLNRVLMSTSGRLQELNLSHNPLEDIGMKHLSAGLRSSECKLRVLRLSQCKVTDRGGAVLIGALKRRTVRLEELDLLGNDFSSQGWMMLEQFLIHSGLGANLRWSSSSRDARRHSTSTFPIPFPSTSTSTSTFPFPSTSTSTSTSTFPFTSTSSEGVPHGSTQKAGAWSSGSSTSSDQSGTSWLEELSRLHFAGYSDLEPKSRREGAEVEKLEVEKLEVEELEVEKLEVEELEVEEQELDQTPSYFEPEVVHEQGSVSYRFRGRRPGVFLCGRTGLGFTMTGRGHLVYRTVQWEEDVLQSAGRVPAGPLFQVQGETGAVSQLHLLHCEVKQQSAALSPSLHVVHMGDEGMSLLEPLQINDTHVVVDVHHFSSFGLVSVIDFFKGVLNIPRLIKSKVLLFHRPTWMLDSQKVNVFLLPNNVPLEEVKCQQRNAEYLEATSLCQLVVHHSYSLQCPEATLVQPSSSLFDLRFGKEHHPNFEIRLAPTTQDAALVVQDQDQTTVWEYCMKLTGTQVDLHVQQNRRPIQHGGAADMSRRPIQHGGAADMNRRPIQHGGAADMNRRPIQHGGAAGPDLQAHPKTRLVSMRKGFIDRVSMCNVLMLLDELWQEDVLNEREYRHVHVLQPDSHRAATALVDMVANKGDPASEIMIQAFLNIDPFLFADLNP